MSSSQTRADLAAAADEDVRALLGNPEHTLRVAGNGRVGFTAGAPVAAGRGVWRHVLADLNHDGKLDVAASSLATRSVSLLLAP